MYRRIIVPSDGSGLSMTSLPYAKLIARAFDSDILLFRVDNTELTSDAAVERAARARLDDATTGLRQEGFRASCHHAPGRVPSLHITAVADAEPDTLVCMSSHGFTGLKRWVLGNVSNEVIKTSRSPVLVIRPVKVDTTNARVGAIVAPLDGSTPAEQALPHIEALARAFSVPIHLMYVADGDAAKRAGRDMSAYLREIADRITSRTGQPAEVHLLQGSPADTIVRHAKPLEDYVVVMTTHSRIGIPERIVGSMADHIARNAEGPVLFVDPGGSR